MMTMFGVLAKWIPNGCWAILLLVSAAHTAWGADELLQVSSIMYDDPRLVVSRSRNVYPDSLKDLWLKALRRPDSELQRLAADAIADAHQRGMQNLEDTADDLMAVLKAAADNDLVSRATARALVILDARESSELLWQERHRSLQLAQTIEPALAKWDYLPIRDEWIERLKNPNTPYACWRLAVDGIRDTAEPRASDALRELVRDPQQVAHRRLAAARALSAIHATGLVSLAEQFAESAADPSERLLAAALLGRHDDEPAVALLSRLATDVEPTVAGAALERLLDIDPQLAAPLAPKAITNADARVRMLGARALIIKADVPALEHLAPLLDDVNPGIRGAVGWAFVQVSEDEQLERVVIDLSVRMLNKDSWRGVEQAALILANLDHEPAADRMIELLEHPRYEASVTAAWALSVLQVPETLPILLDRAQRQFDRLKASLAELMERINSGMPEGERVSEEEQRAWTAGSDQLTHLLQAFGIMRYKEAESLIREFIPKNSGFSFETRAAACWAQGYLYEDNPVEEVVELLAARLMDAQMLNPEALIVRRMCAVSLGRMKAESKLPDLRFTIPQDGSNSYVGRACGWAIEQMTGEVLPPVPEGEVPHMGWFLTPLRKPPGR
jgi:HEAT repeat protein